MNIPITVAVDSITLWSKNTLSNLVGRVFFCIDNTLPLWYNISNCTGCQQKLRISLEAAENIFKPNITLKSIRITANKANMNYGGK